MRIPPLLPCFCLSALLLVANLAPVRGEEALPTAAAKETRVEANALECRWTEKAPVLTGKGDDPAWQGAAAVKGFRVPWAPGSPAAKEGTTAKLLWDREWLYFFATMEDHDVSAEIREHNGHIWENDAFEIFLKPSEKYGGYYEFEVNPAAAVFDAFFPNAGALKDEAQSHRLTFHVEAKVAVRGTLNNPADRDEGWSVEGRIPWTDFSPTGGRPAPDEVWKVNLARVNGPGEAGELSSVAPLTARSFHRTGEYLPLKFSGPTRRARTEWKNTRLHGTPDGPSAYVAERRWPRLGARAVVTVAAAPGGQWVWNIEQDEGWGGPMKVRRFSAAGDGSDAETLLNLEDYAYSIAFHPHFAENGQVFIAVNGPRGSNPEKPPPRTSRVLRYTVRDGKPDPSTRETIIGWSSNGHNGGGIAFGADGMLFTTSGDGSEDSDRDQAGQDAASLRSKVLRIDVDHPANGKRYSVPADNPFLGNPQVAPETWAMGLRNPWRLTFDPASGQLWLGENGQDLWESARLVQRGVNYGWSRFEGSHIFMQGQKLAMAPAVFPTIEHPHSEFRSLTGGMVYRGKQLPELTSAFIYSDFGTGRVWAAMHDGRQLTWQAELCDTPYSVTQVAAGPDGEILLTDYGTAEGGGIYQIKRRPPGEPPPPFPTKLSETGLFSDVASLTPAAGVLGYEINNPGWHDGAASTHHLALPPGGALDYGTEKSWTAPDGTAVAQTLTLNGKRIETRVLLKEDRDWSGYTYVWDAAQGEAALAEKAGVDLELADHQPWRVPSRAECMVCHARQANFTLSLNEMQLNRGEQLLEWERTGLIHADANSIERDRVRREGHERLAEQEKEQRIPEWTWLLPRAPERLRHFSRVNDTSASLEARALSYLGTNCAHCHTVTGGGNSAIDFDWLLRADQLHAINELPLHGGLGLPEARIIAPGDPARSVLVARMSVRGLNQMPPLGTRLPDPDGVRTLVEWIASLPK